MGRRQQNKTERIVVKEFKDESFPNEHNGFDT